jgi:hypothetical protein
MPETLTVIVVLTGTPSVSLLLRVLPMPLDRRAPNVRGDIECNEEHHRRYY